MGLTLDKRQQEQLIGVITSRWPNLRQALEARDKLGKELLDCVANEQLFYPATDRALIRFRDLCIGYREACRTYDRLLSEVVDEGLAGVVL